MLTKETFIKAISEIQWHKKLMDRLNAICRGFRDFRPCLDFSNSHLQALLDMLQQAMNNQYNYFSWWLYDVNDHIIFREENGQ